MVEFSLTEWWQQYCNNLSEQVNSLGQATPPEQISAVRRGVQNAIEFVRTIQEDSISALKQQFNTRIQALNYDAGGLIDYSPYDLSKKTRKRADVERRALEKNLRPFSEAVWKMAELRARGVVIREIAELMKGNYSTKSGDVDWSPNLVHCYFTYEVTVQMVEAARAALPPDQRPGTFEQAVADAKGYAAEGHTNRAIAKMLNGRYMNRLHRKTWAESSIKRLLTDFPEIPATPKENLRKVEGV